jgi:two-component system chemotaxis response regulator CheB
MVKNLLHKVRLMAAVKVVRRTSSRGGHESLQTSLSAAEEVFLHRLKKLAPAYVVIGASTGGPPALALILKKLNVDFPVPILIVQHISRGFLEGMLHWLQSCTALPLHIARQGERPLPGNIYFAPDDCHLELGSNQLLSLRKGPEEYSVKPSVAHLFRSLARSEAPPALGILLSGMGRDGALELLAMRERKQLTIAQDESSSVVNGMPGEAARLGAAHIRLNPEAIAELLIHL